MSNTQPLPLRLADELENDWHKVESNHSMLDAATELRRLYALNQELLKSLKDAASCVKNNYLPDMMGDDWDEVIAKAEAQQ